MKEKMKRGRIERIKDRKLDDREGSKEARMEGKRKEGWD